MLCQNALLFKFVFSLGKKETFGKRSLTMDTTNSILVLLVKSHHHENDLSESEMEENGARDVPDFK